MLWYGAKAPRTTLVWTNLEERSSAGPLESAYRFSRRARVHRWHCDRQAFRGDVVPLDVDVGVAQDVARGHHLMLDIV